MGATTYLAGRDGMRQMDVGRFAEAGITVLQQRYEHPVYPQGHGDFVPFLAVLGPPPSAFVIIGLGRLVRVKEFDVLVAALPAVAVEVPGACLALVGDGRRGRRWRRRRRGSAPPGE